MFTKLVNNKENIFDVIKSVFISLLFSIAFVLIFALFVKYLSVEDSVIIWVNYAIKILSILLASILGIKVKNNGLIKGFFIGLFYYLFSLLLFSIFSMNFHLVKFSFVDLISLSLVGIISGIIAVNIKKR